MVHSINITRTNEVIWGIVRAVYRQWLEKCCPFKETEAQGETGLDDSSGFHSQQFGWMSADQSDWLSDERKRDLISTLTTRITVRFDREFQRHCLEVKFREEIPGISSTCRGSIDPVESGTSQQGAGLWSGLIRR